MRRAPWTSDGYPPARRCDVADVGACAGRALLAAEAADTATGVRLPGSLWVGQPGPLVAALRERTGLDVDLLRSVHEDVDESAHTKFVTVVFAARPGVELSDSMAWTSAADVGSLSAGQADVAELAIRILADLAAGVTNKRMPWTDRGWHLEAEDWLRASCSHADTPVTGAIEPVLSWELS